MSWKTNTCLLVLWAIATSCGPLQLARNDSKSKSAGIPAATLPDYLNVPQDISSVPIGSLGVAAFPPTGSVASGQFIMTLRSEPGASIHYSFAGFTDVDPGQLYESPLLLRPPVSVWAVAEKDGQRGEVTSFTYELPTFLRLPAFDLWNTRLPPSEATPLTAEDPTPFSTVELTSTTEIVVDGDATDWPETSPANLLDQAADLPVHKGDADLVRTELLEDDSFFYALVALRAPPTSNANLSYGFELGPSGITTESFGAGATYIYRIEWKNGTLQVQEKASGKVTVPAATAATASAGQVLEFRIAKTILPEVASTEHLAVRFFSIDARSLTVVTDRTPPAFLRSSFRLHQLDATMTDARSTRVNFHESLASGSAFVERLNRLNAHLLPALEHIGQVPLYEIDDVPIHYVPSEVEGYAGLNTTDRGILTTIHPKFSELEQAQLLSHEVAHLQNAGASRLSERWLQEGFSEWSAMRYLYRSYPSRATMHFLHDYRIQDYFDGIAAGLDEFPLSTWGSEPNALGYPKVMLFFDLLSAVVGNEAMQKALKLAVNFPLTTDSFQLFLENESGKDLSELFQYWVRPGVPAEGYDPRILYVDDDQDGLAATYEAELGTDPNLQDTDGDGFGDGEEYFRGRNPLVSSLIVEDAALPQLVLENGDTSDLLRLGGTPGATFLYSIDPSNSTPAKAYMGPMLLRPPYQVSAAAIVDGQAGTATTVVRELLIDGNVVPTPLPDNALLPATPRSNNVDFNSAVQFGTEPRDFVHSIDAVADMPLAFARFDLSEARLELGDSTVTVTWKAVLPIQKFDNYGAYHAELFATTWSNGNATSILQNSLSVEGDVVKLLARKDDGVSTRATLTEGFTLTFTGTQIQLVVENAVLQAWLEVEADEKGVCFYSSLTLDEGQTYKDRAGCPVVTSQIATRVHAVRADAFGLGEQAVEIWTDQADITVDEAKDLAASGLAGLVSMENLLGRPFFERHLWTTHAFNRNNAVPGHASLRPGAYVNFSTGQLDREKPMLFVEQLARLHVADLLDRFAGESPSFWIQEAYIQWLTSGALYELFKTQDVHGLHRTRIGEYIAFINSFTGNARPPCNGIVESRFDCEVPLAEWSTQTLKSTGSVKSLMFMLLLDAKLGSATMAKAFRTFANHLPSQAEFEAMLIGFAPSSATEIEALFDVWVHGTVVPAADDAAILSEFQDVDGDLLFDFEEEKLGTDPNVFSYYF